MLALFRGGWCPYCELTMAALEEARPAIEALGASAVGIMPEPSRPSPRRRVSAASHYLLLSDPANRFARTCGLAYELSPGHIRLHRERRRDFPRLHGDTTWRLPIPAVFVIEPDAHVAFAFSDVDPARWPDPEELLASLARPARCLHAIETVGSRHFSSGARAARVRSPGFGRSLMTGPLADGRPGLRNWLLAGCSVAALLAAGPVQAADFTVTTASDSGAGSLRAAITALNGSADSTNTIIISSGLGTPITLASDLPAVQKNVVIQANANTLNGANQFRGLFIGAWDPGTATQVPVAVTIQDLAITNTKAQGGAGGGSGGGNGVGGGGGAGLGGALFIANGASVTVSNVSLAGNGAAGGTGSAATDVHLGAGGGGLGGAGGAVGQLPVGGGGGVGVGASGGSSSASAGPGILTGAQGGGQGDPGMSGGADGGGGGAGGIGGGGGGGVGGVSGSSGGSGGSGGFGGGGGGGADFSSGGAGGFGGGGGGGGTSSSGGVGGFGGGGGGGGAGAGGSGGAAGFGGGSGGNSTARCRRRRRRPGRGRRDLRAARRQPHGRRHARGERQHGRWRHGRGGIRQWQRRRRRRGLWVWRLPAGRRRHAHFPAGGRAGPDRVGRHRRPGRIGRQRKLGLTKNGAGTLTLAGANTYSGNTAVNGGLVNFAASNNLGTGTITLNGGGLQWATGTSTDISARLGAVGAAGGTFDTNGNNVTLSSSFGGSTGGIVKTGNGTLTLNAVTQFVGATINGGTLAVAADNNLGAAGSGLAFGGGTLQFNAGFSSGRAITLNAGGGTFDTNGNTATLSGSISGAGGLTKTGTGVLTLSGAGDYAGPTIVGGGTLRAGAANAFSANSDFSVIGGTLDLDNFSQSIGALDGNGSRHPGLGDARDPCRYQRHLRQAP